MPSCARPRKGCGTRPWGRRVGTWGQGPPGWTWGGGRCCGHGRFGIPGCPRRDGHLGRGPQVPAGLVLAPALVGGQGGGRAGGGGGAGALGPSSPREEVDPGTVAAPAAPPRGGGRH